MLLMRFELTDCLMIFFRTFIALIIVAVGVLWPRFARADLEVVTTVPTLAAIAKAVGKEHVSVTSLSLHTQDPHFVDAKPSLALKLNKADLLLAVGLRLESGWLPNLQRGARNAEILPGADGYLDCSTFARLLDKPKNIDRSEGDVHPGGNPHYLFDPRQIAHVAIGIAGKLSNLDPDHAGDYRDNLRALLKSLLKARKKLEKRMKKHRGSRVIAYHRSWVYLVEWLGLRQVAYLEPKPGIPPNPGHVARVLVKARKQGVKVIIQESHYPDTTAKLVAKKSGATLVVLPGGVDVNGGESLVSFVTTLVKRLEKGLRASP